MIHRIFPVLLGLALSACSPPAAPTPVSAPPDRFPDLKAMAGTYTLTIDLDESCSALPAPARHRTYDDTLEDRGWHFLVVNVAGGGFPQATEIGDLMSGQLNAFQPYDPQLRWNNSDLSCDAKERLP